MIVWGSRPITSTQSSGRFACPKCKRESPYQKKRMRRFFTLYFVPLFPTANLGEWIECVRCHTHYKETVLAHQLPPTELERMERLVKAIARVGGLAAKLEGPPNPQLLEKFAASLKNFGGMEMTAAQVQALAGDAKPDPGEARDVLIAAAQGLTMPAKEGLFGMIYRVAAPRGAPSPVVSAFLEAVGEGLGITVAHVKGLLLTLEGSPSRVA